MVLATSRWVLPCSLPVGEGSSWLSSWATRLTYWVPLQFSCVALADLDPSIHPIQKVEDTAVSGTRAEPPSSDQVLGGRTPRHTQRTAGDLSGDSVMGAPREIYPGRPWAVQQEQAWVSYWGFCPRPRAEAPLCPDNTLSHESPAWPLG